MTSSTKIPETLKSRTINRSKKLDEWYFNKNSLNADKMPENSSTKVSLCVGGKNAAYEQDVVNTQKSLKIDSEVARHLKEVRRAVL